MNDVEAILSIVSVIVGSLSGGVSVYFYKQNKDLKIAQVEAARIDNELRQADWEHDRYLEMESRWHKTETILDNTRTDFFNLKEQLNETQRREFKLRILYEYAREGLCNDNQCGKRIPQRDPRRLDELYTRLSEQYYESLNESKNSSVGNPGDIVSVGM